MENIKQYIDQIEADIIEVRRKIHANPELSFEEFETTKLIYNLLKDTAIDLEICSNNTGLIGTLKGATDGPVLAIRADIDALPIVEKTNLPFASKVEGKMHACGHDIHTSVLIGTALTLNHFRDQLKGTVRFIFQPAEEALGGAEFMIKEKALENPKPDHIICLHTWPFINVGEIGVRHETIMASTNRFEITVEGVSGHAAHPHTAVDPIPVAAQIINSIQQIISRKIAPLNSAVVTIGQIEGGTADNVIANEVTMSGTVRTLNDETSILIKEALNKISENVAAAHDATIRFNFIKGTPPVINDGPLVDLMATTVTEQLGEDALVYLEEPSLGGEDFAFYFEEVKGMLFRLGTANEDERSRKGLHNPEIIFDERAIKTGIQAMSLFTMNYFEKKNAGDLTK